MTTPADQLLVDIARCHQVNIALRNESHDCHTVCTVGKTLRHTPEPWSGHIETAPILFISSNPSISSKEVFPTVDYGPERLIRFFHDRFESKPDDPAPVNARMRTLITGEAGIDYSGRAVAFLSHVRNRAEELLGRAPRPGVDYAITEVVHCKSGKERGVAEAQNTCVPEWLGRVLEVSGAQVIVGLGKRAGIALARKVGMSYELGLVQRTVISGRERLIVFLPHPSQRGASKRNLAPCTPEGVEQLMQWIRANAD